jgi:hypothetical protein
LDGAATIGGNLWDAGSSFVDSVKEPLADAGNKLMEGDILGAAGSAVKASFEGLKSVGSSIAGWFGFSKGTPEVQSGGLAMIHPGEMIIPANFPIAKAALGGIGEALKGAGAAYGGPIGMLVATGIQEPSATAASAVMPTADIHDRVERDIAGARSATSVGGKELSMISSSTDQQCRTLVEIRDHLKAMKDNMEKVDTSSGYSPPIVEGGDTSSNIQPKNSAQYYTWQFGQHGQIGNKQVINPGT